MRRANNGSLSQNGAAISLAFWQASMNLLFRNEPGKFARQIGLRGFSCCTSPVLDMCAPDRVEGLPSPTTPKNTYIKRSSGVHPILSHSDSAKASCEIDDCPVSVTHDLACLPSHISLAHRDPAGPGRVICDRSPGGRLECDVSVGNGGCSTVSQQASHRSYCE